MYYKQHFKKVSKPDDIPNPEAPILEMYMDLHGCDIVSAHNIRMEELWVIYESERVRISSPEHTKSLRDLSNESMLEQIELLLSMKPNASAEEQQEIKDEVRTRFERSLEKTLQENDEYIRNVLTPPDTKILPV